MTDLNFVPVLALGLIVYTLLSLAKALTNRQWNAALTLVVGYGCAVGATFLVGATQWADGVEVGGTTLGATSGADKLVVAFVVLSLASAGYDFKRAVDRSDSAQTPPLTSLGTEKEPSAVIAHDHGGFQDPQPTGVETG